MSILGIENVNSISIKKNISDIDNRIIEIQKELECLEDKRSVLQYQLEIVEKNEIYENSLVVAKNNRDFAIELFGGNKKVFGFANLSFIPIKYSCSKKEYDLISHSMMSGYGIVSEFKYFEICSNNGKKLCSYCPEYTHEDFYSRSTLKRVDIFYCLDNGRFYIPCNYELMLIPNNVLEKLSIWDNIKKITTANLPI